MAAHLSEIDKKLLREIQRDLPLTRKPYFQIGTRCELSERDVIQRVKRLIGDGIIRDIPVIFNSWALGYKGTLVAVQIDDAHIESVALKVNTHRGVSHNYLRKHRFNLWFTLTIAKDGDFDEETRRLLQGEMFNQYLILPSVKNFKIGVYFGLDGEDHVQTYNDTQPYASIKLSEKDRSIIAALQDGLAIVPEPWLKIAHALNIDESELLEHVRRYKNEGAIRRISAILRHRNVGYSANGMACFNVSEKDILEAGRSAAKFNQVSHCYQRPTYPEWKYSLFAMVHAKSNGECDDLISRIADSIHCNDYVVLYSIREFKKERVKYFMEKPS
jgi:DNA-binding Lrp family transcriptional regulator